MAKTARERRRHEKSLKSFEGRIGSAPVKPVVCDPYETFSEHWGKNCSRSFIALCREPFMPPLWFWDWDLSHRTVLSWKQQTNSVKPPYAHIWFSMYLSGSDMGAQVFCLRKEQPAIKAVPHFEFLYLLLCLMNYTPGDVSQWSVQPAGHSAEQRLHLLCLGCQTLLRATISTHKVPRYLGVSIIQCIELGILVIDTAFSRNSTSQSIQGMDARIHQG
ncbi:uncharacterized protein LOC113987752 [Pipra filicauda]|uniref:Uncharacterized protein LOC113987752 n=1 Tax=Pipra filicauda TaxID=649802 RepID=A0A7R5KCB4_9PASS|nr:uncharacterized protein LOC113987752 [Pipra filicauda]